MEPLRPLAGPRAGFAVWLSRGQGAPLRSHTHHRSVPRKDDSWLPRGQRAPLRSCCVNTCRRSDRLRGVAVRWTGRSLRN
eukprot:11842390-Alexandrium_andersonii.AAC.1